MPHNLVLLSPATRVNDCFVSDTDINASLPVNVKKNALVAGNPNDPNTRFQAEFYKKIACDIVSETVFNYPYPYISEKILRPIACKRMFIVLGPCGILELLKQKGFQTFGDFINEEYDQITDPKERFIRVVSEIKNLCNTPLSSIQYYIRTNSAKFEHNFTHLKKLQELELQQIADKFDIKL